MTHFDNSMEREIFEAINLLKDENLVWSSDFQAIRRNLAGLLERIMQVEWHFVEPEIGDLCLNLIRVNERENNVRESSSTSSPIYLSNKDSIGQTGNEGSGCSGCCTCKSRLD